MPIFFVACISLIAVTDFTAITMKVRVNGELPEDKKFSWWSRNDLQVMRKYAELYPDSDLPFICKLCFAAVIVLGLMFAVFSWSGS